MKFSTWKAAWSLLSKRERLISLMVLAISILGAGAQVAMIGSIMPFLTFVSDPAGAGDGFLFGALRKISGIEGDYQFAMLLGGLAIATIIISNLMLLMRSYAISRFTVMRIHNIGSRLLKSYLSRPYEFFLGRNSGDIGKRILSETSEFSYSFLQPAAEFVASAISAICILAFLTYVEPLGTLAGISCILVLYFGVYRFSSRLVKRLGEERSESNRRRFMSINEIFGGIKDLKVHRKEDVYVRRFEEASRVFLQATWRARIASDTPQYLVQAFFFSAIIVACLVLIDEKTLTEGGQVISGMIPALGIFAFAGQRLVPEIQRMYAAISKITYGAAALRNVHEDILPSSEFKEATKTALPFTSNVEMRGLSYAYPGVPAGLSDISVTIPKGARVGIVGGTGAGKTTFVDVVLGLLSPTSGDLLVDGQSTRDPQVIDQWRNNISYVPQSIFLADATIAENIAFGVPSKEIDRDRVVECARIAQIHDFITSQTTKGYDTVTGERGVMLSGGQRQRIGIARALYRGTDLLVLDEATSALDPKTEHDVMEAIKALPRSITILTIAHRLGTIRHCDRVLVLDKGELVESGSWDELIALNGVFATSVRSYGE
jgi:ATP-binding cassette, subfamily B, bacterial PglK